MEKRWEIIISPTDTLDFSRICMLRKNSTKNSCDHGLFSTTYVSLENRRKLKYYLWIVCVYQCLNIWRQMALYYKYAPNYVPSHVNVNQCLSLFSFHATNLLFTNRFSKAIKEPSPQCQLMHREECCTLQVQMQQLDLGILIKDSFWRYNTIYC